MAAVSPEAKARDLAYHREYQRRRRAEQPEACRAEGREWARANREKRRETERRYREKHPEQTQAIQERRKPKIRAWLKADREANPEKYHARFTEWHEKNSDYNRDRKLAWIEANPDAHSAQINRRRARLMAAEGEGVSPQQWKAIMADYGRCCAYCARPGRLTMDHVIPLSNGGTHDIHNVVPACRSCNSSKNNKTLIVWLALRAG